MRLNHAEFFERLRFRDTWPGGPARFDAELWEEHGEELTILVSDLSGFSRLTRQHGVIHFMHIHRRCIDLGIQAVEQHGGDMVKTEADNFIAALANPREAIGAALDLLDSAHELNRVLEPDARVRCCLGIATGLALRLADDVYGDVVNVAYKLGEDVAEPFEVLVSESSVPRLSDGDIELSDRRVVTVGGVELGYHLLIGHPAVAE